MSYEHYEALLKIAPKLKLKFQLKYFTIIF